MVKIRATDASAFQKSGRSQDRELTPRQQQDQKFQRMIGRLQTEDQAFQVRPEGDEKLPTLRNRLLRAAAAQNKELAVRKQGDGFIVGLMTPDRRSTRGRRRRSA